MPTMPTLEGLEVTLAATLLNTDVLQVTGGLAPCESLCDSINLEDPQIPPTCWAFTDFGNNTCTLFVHSDKSKSRYQ